VDTDGITQGGELHTLDSLNITSISLDATLLQGEFINSSQITHESNFTTSDGASHKEGGCDFIVASLKSGSAERKNL